MQHTSVMAIKILNLKFVEFFWLPSITFLMCYFVWLLSWPAEGFSNHRQPVFFQPTFGSFHIGLDVQPNDVVILLLLQLLDDRCNAFFIVNILTSNAITYLKPLILLILPNRGRKSANLMRKINFFEEN